MSKLIFLLAFLLTFSLSIVSAQTVTYNFESPRRAVGAANASISGVVKFPNGTPMNWTLNYNSTEKKPVSMSFQRPEFIPFNVFSVEIQAMTAGEFGAGVSLCPFSPSGLIECVISLWGQAMTECAMAGNQGENCWMGSTE